ncbi:MAG: hypothetical protein O7G83_05290 [Proteobacteria bacterium]|nr:hypothetical protein [Pseudomonadota bacterium]
MQEEAPGTLDEDGGMVANVGIELFAALIKPVRIAGFPYLSQHYRRRIGRTWISR